jgi:hypothetical protein
VGVYEEGFCVSMDFDHKIWGALPIIVRGMYRVSCLFDRSAHLFVDLPARSAILSGIQAALSCTPQISFADSSNSQSVRPGCIPPRSIQGPDQGDRHGWGVDHRRPP